MYYKIAYYSYKYKWIELFISNKRNHNKVNVLKDVLNLYVKEIKDFS